MRGRNPGLCRLRRIPDPRNRLPGEDRATPKGQGEDRRRSLAQATFAERLGDRRREAARTQRRNGGLLGRDATQWSLEPELGCLLSPSRQGSYKLIFRIPGTHPLASASPRARAGQKVKSLRTTKAECVVLNKCYSHVTPVLDARAPAT